MEYDLTSLSLQPPAAAWVLDTLTGGSEFQGSRFTLRDLNSESKNPFKVLRWFGNVGVWSVIPARLIHQNIILSVVHPDRKYLYHYKERFICEKILWLSLAFDIRRSFIISRTPKLFWLDCKNRTVGLINTRAFETCWLLSWKYSNTSLSRPPN